MVFCSPGGNVVHWYRKGSHRHSLLSTISPPGDDQMAVRSIS
jgi:hypothetical protein